MHGQVTLNGHRGAVSALTYAASGALLASGSQDTDIVVWDAAEQAGLYRLRGHTDEITALVNSLSLLSNEHLSCWPELAGDTDDVRALS